MPKPTEAQLTEYLSEHLAYERRMLLATYARLKTEHNQFMWNVLYESFSIHARNIYDFLRHDGNNNTISADHYITSHQKPPHLGRFNDLDGFLFHTSADRQRKEKLDREALRGLAEWIDKHWPAWAEGLNEPYRSLVEIVPIEGKAVSFAETTPTACSAVWASTITI